MKGNIKISALIWTALLIRVLSQLIWEWSGLRSLQMHEFFYGMIIVTHIWFLFETARLLTCMFAAFLALKLYFLVKQKFGLTGIGAFIAYILISSGIAYPHASIWIIADCNAWSGEVFAWKCIRAHFPWWL